MFQDRDLEEHLQDNNTLSVESLIIAEWNLNSQENILQCGNYRYRPNEEGSIFNELSNVFDPEDLGNFYTDATQSSTVSSYTVNTNGEDLIFTSIEKDRELYYSLKDCFEPYRPRSGINKVLWFNGKHIDTIRSEGRPRYYISSRADQFKYWTSYRKEEGFERGISFANGQQDEIGHVIEDSVPFVVYKEPVTANRIVLKMQTNLSNETEKQIRTLDGRSIIDPLTDRNSSSIPKIWEVQYLDDNNVWNTAAAFDQTSTRIDGSDIVDSDGYVELYYGIIIPEEYRTSFHFVDYLKHSSQLANGISNGESYIIGSSDSNAGQLYIWSLEEQDWEVYEANFGFSLYETDDTKRLGIVKNVVNPRYYVNSINETVYHEFAFVKGLRIKVDSIFGVEKPFDLIEISPRFKIDFSEYTTAFDVIKSVALSSTDLPVGGLIASNGTITAINFNGAFDTNNVFNRETGLGSLTSKLIGPNIKFDIYETIKNVKGFDKYIPIKTFYSEDFSSGSKVQESFQIELRDFFFRLESMKAPTIFLKNITLTAAVAVVLDNIGFSNYVFKKLGSESDPVIPYFFVEPDITVAEVLNRLAIATQTAMFFDEFNNFTLMSKEFFIPKSYERQEDLVLFGQKTGDNLPNIISIDNTETKIINDGQINYVTRYIQRIPSSLNQATKVDEDRTYIYKPTLLWEVSGQEETKTINEKAKNTSNYALGAAALNSDLTDQVPTVVNNQIIDNIIDLGENVYWLPRFQGYLYANSEIIKYSAVEYAISGGAVGLDVGRFKIIESDNLFTIIDIKKDNEFVAEFEFAASETESLSKAKKRVKQEALNRIVTLSDTKALSSNTRGASRSTVFIKNNQEYQKYFANLPFNGKMYPTGNVKIYCEPFYEELSGATEYELEPGVVYKNGQVKKHGRAQFGTSLQHHRSGLDPYWSDNNNVRGCKMSSQFIFSTTPTEKIQYPTLGNINNPAGVNNVVSQQSSRNGIVANFMRQVVPDDDFVKSARTTSAGTIQSSALVFNGPSPIPAELTAKDFVSYVYKNFDDDHDYRHFGTRMRIVGRPEINEKFQTPANASEYFVVPSRGAGDDVIISGGSGGIAAMINPETNVGYYFEICSLTSDKLHDYTRVNESNNETVSVIHNIIFYKVVTGQSGEAIPVKLYGGIAQILVDTGKFVGMDRVAKDENPTVYDLAIEYENVGSARKFYLYINNTIIAIVDDLSPLPIYNSMALFVRGSSKCMFENVYALKNLQSKETGKPIVQEIPQVFGKKEILSSDALRKYAMSGILQATYLSGISAENSPKYEMFYDEFGTIMRECAYFNVKYDQAYPAFLAFLAPTFNKEKTYTTSGFYAGSYGAEFLIFNSTDKAIVLDETSGNYLRIIGVSFTQDTSQVLTVDDYFAKLSNFSDPIVYDNAFRSPEKVSKVYDGIQESRSKYGKFAFSLDSHYIQNYDAASNLMEWIVDKTLRKRKKIGLNIFGTPTIQLGDLVKINYEIGSEGNNYNFVNEDTKFVVYSISYNRTASGPTMSLEVIEI